MPHPAPAEARAVVRKYSLGERLPVSLPSAVVEVAADGEALLLPSAPQSLLSLPAPQARPRARAASLKASADSGLPTGEASAGSGLPTGDVVLELATERRSDLAFDVLLIGSTKSFTCTDRTAKICLSNFPFSSGID